MQSVLLPQRAAPAPTRKQHCCARSSTQTAAARRRPCRILLCRAYADPSSSFDVPAFEGVAKDDRKQLLSAVDRLGLRCTAADVAAASGLDVETAERNLQSLVNDVMGTMKVAEDGELIYEIPSTYRATLAASSLSLRLEPFTDKVTKAASFTARAAFGAMLISSILITYVAIMALLSSSSRDSDNRGSRGPSGGAFFRVSPLDFMFWDMSPRQRQRQQRERNQQGSSENEMNFLEAIFSVVFGDGDPNAAFEGARWRAAGAYVTARGGVVTAEELALFLDPPAPGRLSLPGPIDGSIFEDEAFVVPALQRLGGEASVTDNGNLLYTFPKLQRTAGQRSISSSETSTSFERVLPCDESDTPALESPTQDALGTGGWAGSMFRRAGAQVAPVREQGIQYMQQAPWTISAAPAGSQAAVAALGAVNILGVAFLTNLATVNAFALAADPSLAWIPSILPFLQAYAAVFVAAPLVRWGLNALKNARLAITNSSRVVAAQALADPTPELRAKLLQARALAKSEVIAMDDVVYSTEAGANDSTSEDYSSFDRRLSDKKKEPEAW